IKPTDPDMKWTGWALDTLRELVAIDMLSKRMISTQQQATPAGSESVADFDLKQSRLSRSVRLSIAMTERIRAQYLMRRGKRKDSGEQERRRQRREQAADTVAKAIAQPEDVDYMRNWVWEKLVEDEILDEQLDTLSPEDFMREVCRKIGRSPPHPIRVPQGWDDGAEAEDVEPAETARADREPAEAWPHPSDDSDTGRCPPKPSQPDSS
ncbi:MAG: hypothetical protein ACRC67_02690, partial [Inquilinus sp.]|uniref:hypothetical protein n=1 Tax=Inquilinus sp. TaxID=1932117 RepID=UPI003F2CC444